jgi:predicted nucleic acid-binding protein
VTSALRSLVLRGEVAPTRAGLARVHLRALSIQEYPFEPLAERVWALRDNVTVYDAWYVALAEALDTDLVTADARLVSATGPRCAVLAIGEFAARDG